VRELGEIFILYNEVVQIVTQVVGTGGSTMAIEHSKKAYLRPFDRQVLLRFGFEDIKYNRYTVFVVIANDSLVSVGCVTFNHSTFLLRGLCRLMVLQKQSFRVQNWWIFTKE